MKTVWVAISNEDGWVYIMGVYAEKPSEKEIIHDAPAPDALWVRDKDIDGLWRNRMDGSTVKLEECEVW